MIKRLIPAILVLVATAVAADKKNDSKPVEKKSNGTKIIDTRDIRALSPEERKKLFGKEDGKIKNGVDVRINMKKDRQLKLKYVKEFAVKIETGGIRAGGLVSINKQWVAEGGRCSEHGFGVVRR